MSPGGLKLSVEAGARGDRRARFAAVALTDLTAEDSWDLVTDARGQMRFHLPDGRYELSVRGGAPVAFEVRDRRWTPVRMALS